MSKYANAGELRTPVTIMKLIDGTDEDGFPRQEWVDLFGMPVLCKWVNAHGSEVYEGMRLGLQDTATLTMRYSPQINARCRIFLQDDPDPFEVISLDNVENRREFLEIKVKRVIAA